jgi:hypothetical protein
MICIAVRRAEIVRKMIQEEREREGDDRWRTKQREENARYATEIAICSDSQ